MEHETGSRFHMDSNHISQIRSFRLYLRTPHLRWNIIDIEFGTESPGYELLYLGKFDREIYAAKRSKSKRTFRLCPEVHRQLELMVKDRDQAGSTWVNFEELLHAFGAGLLPSYILAEDGSWKLHSQLG